MPAHHDMRARGERRAVPSWKSNTVQIRWDVDCVLTPPRGLAPGAVAAPPIPQLATHYRRRPLHVLLFRITGFMPRDVRGGEGDAVRRLHSCTGACPSTPTPHPFAPPPGLIMGFPASPSSTSRSHGAGWGDRELAHAYGGSLLKFSAHTCR